MGKLEEIAKERWDHDYHRFTSFPAHDDDEARCLVAYAAPEMLALLLCSKDALVAWGSQERWEEERDALLARLHKEVGDG